MGTNINRPNGARLIGSLDGGPATGAVRNHLVASGNATAIFPGDFMILNDDGTVSPYTGTGGGDLLGVCVGVKVNRAVAATEHPGYLPASTAGTVFVAEGKELLFEVQANGSGGTATTAVGSNANVKATAGDTTFGSSRHELDMSTLTDSSPASAQLRIVEISPQEGNFAGTDYTRLIVMINKNVYITTTGL